MQLVLELCATAEAVEPALGAVRGEEMRKFLARMAPVPLEPFQATNVLKPLGASIGTALRNQWSARKLQQAWKNFLALTAEDVIGPGYAAIPVKV
jgi:hypothetical protein